MEQQYGVKLDQFGDVSNFMKTFIVERYKDYTINQRGKKLRLAEMIKDMPNCDTQQYKEDIAHIPFVGWGSNVKPYQYPDVVQNREPLRSDAIYAAQYANVLAEQF